MKLILSIFLIFNISVIANAQTFNKQLQQRADMGDAVAVCELAWCYYEGSGVKKDEHHAISLFEKAASMGNVDAMCYAAEYYEEGALDYNKAFYWYEKAAQHQCKEHYFTVGVWYYYGQGVDYNPCKALYWFKKGAEEGSAASMYYIAVIYDNGEGVTQDVNEAYRWFLKAARKGDVMSYHYLGTYYEFGIGVDKDVDTARKLYRAYKEAEDGNKVLAKKMLHEVID